jgi:FAS-associated factor 2
MKRDGERIRAAREREREAVMREEAEAERARLKLEENERRERRKKEQEVWRRYARRTLVPVEPGPGTGERGVRVTVRIASGQRRTRTFPSSAPVEAIYAWVETLSIPADQGPGEDPEAPPEGYTHEWGFVLATTFPRVVVPCEEGVSVGEVEVLRGGVVLVVEGTAEDEEEDDDEDSKEEDE